MKNENGFSLMEVIIAMALLIIISGSFIGAYAAHHSTIHRGKEITRDTFEAQEEIEIFLTTLTGDAHDEEKNYTVFGRTVTGKTVEQEIKGSRVFYTYVSDQEFLSPLSPQISNAIVKAYAGPGSSIQTYPWNGSELRAEYVNTDLLIYGEILRWYESIEESGSLILNPRFPGQYVKIQEHWEPLEGKVLSQTHTQNPGRYIVFGVTPFSDVGKIGREERIPVAQILLMNNPNNYWGDFIEKVYLDQFGIGDLLKRASYANIHTYTTLNQERLTLNVETEDNVKKSGSFVYAEIPSNNNYDFSVILEVKVDENSYNESNEIGYGVFIGEADTVGRDSGYMVEFDAGNDNVILRKMINGEYDTGFIEEEAVEFPWTERHKIKISILKSLNKCVIDFYNESGDPDENDGDPQIIFENIDINKNNQYIGFKTWSDVDHIDESVEIQVGQKKLSAHFYDISFKLNLAEPPVLLAVNNAQAFANTSIGSTITLSGYAVPEDIGNKNILVVWVQAEYSANSEASSCNFNGNTMTKIPLASTLYHGSSGTIYTGGAMFYKVVTAGETGNIVASFLNNGSNVTNGTIHAVTLSGVDTIAGPKVSRVSTVTSSPITTSLTGLTNGDIVITGGTNNINTKLNATGQGHEELTTLVVGNNNSAGAQGFIKVTGTEVTGVGWTADGSILRAIVSLVAFSPAN